MPLFMPLIMPTFMPNFHFRSLRCLHGFRHRRCMSRHISIGPSSSRHPCEGRFFVQPSVFRSEMLAHAFILDISDKHTLVPIGNWGYGLSCSYGFFGSGIDLYKSLYVLVRWAWPWVLDWRELGLKNLLSCLNVSPDTTHTCSVVTHLRDCGPDSVSSLRRPTLLCWRWGRRREESNTLPAHPGSPVGWLML